MQIKEVLIEGSAFVFLCICTIFDIRRKEIPLLLLGSGLAAALGINMWKLLRGELLFSEAGACLLPGFFFLFLSFCTKEKIGVGDGIMLSVVGLFTGFYDCFFVLCISLVLSSVTVLALLLLHKVGKESRIPFAPFLTLGMGVVFFVAKI